VRRGSEHSQDLSIGEAFEGVATALHGLNGFFKYAARCVDGRFHLGDFFMWSEGPVVVYNLATQEHWKRAPRLDRRGRDGVAVTCRRERTFAADST
jgi:hypothetical protein